MRKFQRLKAIRLLRVSDKVRPLVSSGRAKFRERLNPKAYQYASGVSYRVRVEFREFGTLPDSIGDLGA